MKKLNKAFAVLTVLAMLATLFVAVPASAGTITCQPTIDVLFTSDDAMETPVNPDTLDAGAIFYAWPQYGGLDPDAYLFNVSTILTWDADVVAPYDLLYEEALTPDHPEYYFAGAEGGALLNSPDFNRATREYKSGRKTTGAYNCSDSTLTVYRAGQNGISGTDTNVFGVGIFPGNNGDISASTDNFSQANADGTFVPFGFAFIKLDAGNTGVTIPGKFAGKVLNGAAVTDLAGTLEPAELVFTDMPKTGQEVGGATLSTYNYSGTGTVAGQVTDISPVDSASTPTDEPTEAPTEVPEAEGEVTGAKQASKSDKAFNQNAFFYEFETPTIPGEVTGLTATFQIPGKDAVQGDVTNVNLTGISNVALNIAAVIKNIPAGQEDTPVTTTYTLTYSVGGVEKTLQWSRTNSLN